jgi:hypothetical protein
VPTKQYAHRNLGPRSDPQEVRDLRQSSFDFHETLGTPVLFKHRWNLEDEKNGVCKRCPLHDYIYGQDSIWDELCFGTGFLGGYADGIVVFVTMGDSQEDVIRFDPQGVMIRDRHPGMSAPWLPKMGDGDLIIQAEFDPNTYDILDLSDRYVLKEVTPVTMRGPGRSWGGKGFLVNQESLLDRLPLGNHLYNVPVVFDYAAVDVEELPQDYDPNVVYQGEYTSDSRVVKIRGAEQFFTAIDSRDVRVAVEGVTSIASANVRITGRTTTDSQTGDPDGTHIINL